MTAHDGVHLFVIPEWMNHMVTVLVAAAALWKGGGSERAIGIGWALLSHARLGLMLSSRAMYVDPPVWLWIGPDALTLVICLACLRRAERYWVVWATSFAALAVVADLLALAPGMTLWATASASLGSTYLLHVAVLWGVWTTWRGRAIDDLRPRPE